MSNTITIPAADLRVGHILPGEGVVTAVSDEPSWFHGAMGRVYTTGGDTTHHVHREVGTVEVVGEAFEF